MKGFITELHTFPPIPIIQRYLSGEKWILEMNETYNKGSFRNRYHLSGPQGLTPLSIPLKKGKNNQQPIAEVEISYDEDWPRRHSKTIQSCYGKSPFFEEYFTDLKSLFFKDVQYLKEFNISALKLVLAFLGIQEWPQLSTCYLSKIDYEKTGIVDCRDFYRPKTIDQLPIKNCLYNQVFEPANGFISNLSVLDIIFCLGPEARLKLVREG